MSTGRYIALVDTTGQGSHRAGSFTADTMEKLGVRVLLDSLTIRLLASDSAPMLAVPGGGILIGHLFTNSGLRVRSGTRFPQHLGAERTREHILRNYWGSYVLVQPPEQPGGELTFSRCPSFSGDPPCVYSLKNGVGFVTSDISLAVRSGLHQGSVDWDFIAQRLRYPGLKTQRTAIVGVRELLPGTSVRLRGSESIIRQEWSPWKFVAPECRFSDPREASDSVRLAVMNAVRAWAETDGSVLLELSGGLDSSIVAAGLRDSRCQVTCYNLVSPLPGADERHYAALVAETIGTDLHTEELSFDAAAFSFEPPTNSVTPGMGPLQHAIDMTMGGAARDHKVSSSFTGGGGDTVFCYLRTAAPAVDALRERGFRGAATAIVDLAQLHQCTLWRASKTALRKALQRPKPPCNEDTTFIPAGTACEKPEEHPWFRAPDKAMPGDRERIFDLASNQLFQGQAPRSTSVGLRFPLLSQPVLESCLRTPSWMWNSGGQNRAVARAAFAGLLPQEVLLRQSKGTFMAYLGAVYERDQQAIARFLLDGQLSDRGLLDRVALEKYFGRDLPVRDRSFLRIFNLCMVENWVRHRA